MADNIGIPSESVDRVTDFIDTLWTNLVEVLVLALLEMFWDLLVVVFVNLAPVWGFALMIVFWLYMFQRKYIANAR